MTMPNSPRHYDDELPLYVAGYVSPEMHAAIERHLAECAACRRECEIWRSLPDVFASLDAAPAPQTSIDTIWSTLAPQLHDAATANGRTIAMSISDFPSEPPLVTQPVHPIRTIRPNTWAAVAVVLVVILLMGGFFAIARGRPTSSSVGAKPAATATTIATVTATAIPPNLVTKSDAEALFNGFLTACEDPATYTSAGQGVPCAKLDRGRIYALNGTSPPHYCADDWHLISSLLADTQANLQNYNPQIIMDGTPLHTTRTPIRIIDPTYSQQHYGGQYYYIQVGEILSPQQITAGTHTLHITFNSYNNQFAFTVDASGTGVCAAVVSATPSATNTPAAGAGVTGTWTGYAPSMITGNGRDCYILSCKARPP